MAKKFGRRYPWDEWFAKGRFVLRKGTDFGCTASIMAQMVRNRASQLKLQVSVQCPSPTSVDVVVVREKA